MITDKGEYIEFYEADKTDEWKESKHQKDSYAWVKYNHPEWLAWHTKNEGVKSMATAISDADEGLLKGVSDFVIIIGPFGPYHFAAIEMKRTNKSGRFKASPVSKEQKEFLSRVRELGGFSAVCYGFKQFKNAIDFMLNSTNC